MQYTVRFLVFALQLSVKLIDIRMEKETLLCWNGIVEENVPIYVQQVQHLEPGDISQTHSQ